MSEWGTARPPVRPVRRTRRRPPAEPPQDPGPPGTPAVAPPELPRIPFQSSWPAPTFDDDPPPLPDDDPVLIRQAATLALATASERRHPVARCRWCGGPFRWVFEQHWLCASEDCAYRQLASAVRRRGMSENQSPYLFVPLPVQIEVEEDMTPNLLVAGAAGTSKSYGARWLAYKFCRRIAGARVLLLRLTYQELERNHLQFFPGEARELGAKYVGSVRQCRFPNNSIIFAGYCRFLTDITQHIGVEYDLVIFEEGIQFFVKALEEISSRARGSEPGRASMRAAGFTGGLVRILSNPGGRAMLYLSDAYITKTLDQTEYPEYDPHHFGHLHTTLEDNPYLPPDYIEKHLSHLSKARFKQLRAGDWTVQVGQFFDFETDLHVARVEA